MYETLLRPIEVFQIPPLPNIAVVSEKIKISEQKREEKRLRQIAANNKAAGAGGSSATATTSVNAKRKREDAAEDLDDEDDADEMSAVEGLIASKKKLRTDIGDDGDDDEEEDGMEEDALPLPEGSGKIEGSDPSPQPATTTSHQAPSSLTHPSAKINVSKALPEVRGHTSYLTFACLIPIPAPAVSQEDSKTKAEENP